MFYQRYLARHTFGSLLCLMSEYLHSQVLDTGTFLGSEGSAHSRSWSDAVNRPTPEKWITVNVPSLSWLQTAFPFVLS